MTPFFIIGSPRSGTTMLRLMLTCHPKLVVPPECGFIIWLERQFAHWSASDFAGADNLSRFADAIFTSRKFDTWNLPREAVHQAVVTHRPSSYSAACDTVYRLFASRSGKPQAIWGDKNNYYLSHIATLKTLYPKARFLHIVRDGRDVACSYREAMALKSGSPYRPNLPLSINDIAQKWTSDIRVIQKQLAALEPEDKYEIRYEDLTADPTKELTCICEWLKVRFARNMLNFHVINRTALLEPTATMDWKQRTLIPTTTAMVGRYLCQLDVGEAEAFVASASLQLRHYGYID